MRGQEVILLNFPISHFLKSLAHSAMDVAGEVMDMVGEVAGMVGEGCLLPTLVDQDPGDEHGGQTRTDKGRPRQTRTD